MLSFRIWSWPDECSNEAESIQGDDLSTFLDLCLENAAYISLQHSRWRNCNNHRLERRLAPYLIKTLETKTWFGYDFTEAPPGWEYTMKINLYRADAAVKSHLLRWMDDIFMEVMKDGRLHPSTQSLEDLCIFSETGIIMGTVSHEHILAVEPQSQDFSQALLKYGNWTDVASNEYSGMPVDMRVFTD